MVHFIPETDSTNLELRRRLNADGELPHGYCIIADYQTSGHGQATNAWESERGANLLFSLLLHPTDINVAEQFVITEIVSLAIRDALQQEISDEIEIKWPNDIYVADRKICGVLIENSVCGAVISDSIIGVGININQTVFTSDAPNPVSLYNISGKRHERNAILQRIYTSVLEQYALLAQDTDGTHRAAIHSRYMQHLYHRTGWHCYRKPDETDVFRAKIEGIDSFGLLTLRMEDNSLCTFAFKEIVQSARLKV